MSTPPLRLYGTPHRFDTVFKRIARRAALTLGTLFIPILAWLELWMWVPVPLLLLVVANEFAWWLRDDRAIELRLSDDGLLLLDRKRDEERWVQSADITAINVWYRLHPRGYEVHLALLDAQEVCFAASMLCETDTFEAYPTDINVNQWEELLGETAGIRTSVAASGAAMRQHLQGPALLGWVRAHFDAHLHARTWARVWQGEAPDLSLFGVHASPPDGLIQSATNATLIAPDGSLLEPSTAPLAHAERDVTLLEKTDAGPQPVEGRIGLAVIATSDAKRLVCPCAEVGHELQTLGGLDLHTHTPEAMALMSHHAYHVRRGALPPRPKTH